MHKYLGRLVFWGSHFLVWLTLILLLGIVVYPKKGCYIGAYVDFGEREDTVTQEAISNYQDLVGKHQAIIAFSNDWGLLNFPKEQLDTIYYRNHSLALVYWSPWDRPLGAPQARNRFHLKKVLAGEWDSYIDSWAKQAKEFGQPIFVSWGLEMNGNWFPWSGAFYGADFELAPGKYAGPETFKKSYRYVVDRVRRAGASNIIWVFHPNNTSDPNEPWNSMQNYYPGDEYVDWIGASAYGQQYPDQGWVELEQTLDWPYENLVKLNPSKPIMLAEFGIGSFDKGDRNKWLDEAFTRLESGRFPRIKALIYWHEDWKNGDGKISDLRVDASPGTVAVFRKHLSNSYWLESVIK